MLAALAPKSSSFPLLADKSNRLGYSQEQIGVYSDCRRLSLSLKRMASNAARLSCYATTEGQRVGINTDIAEVCGKVMFGIVQAVVLDLADVTVAELKRAHALEEAIGPVVAMDPALGELYSPIE